MLDQNSKELRNLVITSSVSGFIKTLDIDPEAGLTDAQRAYIARETILLGEKIVDELRNNNKQL